MDLVRIFFPRHVCLNTILFQLKTGGVELHLISKQWLGHDPDPKFGSVLIEKERFNSRRRRKRYLVKAKTGRIYFWYLNYIIHDFGFYSTFIDVSFIQKIFASTNFITHKFVVTTPHVEFRYYIFISSDFRKAFEWTFYFM